MRRQPASLLAEKPNMLMLIFLAFGCLSILNLFQLTSTNIFLCATKPTTTLQMITGKKQMNYCLKMLFLHKDESKNEI